MTIVSTPQMSWSMQKSILAALFAVLAWAVQVAVSATMVAVLGPAMGAPVMFFVGPLLFVVAWRIIAAKGSLLLMGVILAMLYLPIPALGPPGFFPKIALVFLYAAIHEGVLLLLKDKGVRISGAIAGAAGNVAIITSMLFLFSLFQIPGADRLLDMIVPFLMLAVVEGLLGGFLGGVIYGKIHQRPIIRRIQQR